MKKTFGVLLAIAFLASCGNNKKQEETVTEVQEVTETVQPIADGSTAQSALDYEGTYSGILPTASGEGMKVVINLTGKGYTKDLSYVGVKNSDTHSSGTYTWNDSGNIITLQGEEKPNQYFVGENTLTQLNVDGQKVKGDIAKEYILQKQQ